MSFDSQRVSAGRCSDQRRSRFKLARKKPRGTLGVGGGGGGGLTFGEPGGHGETPHMSSGGLVYIQRTMSAPQQALVTANRADLGMMWR